MIRITQMTAAKMTISIMFEIKHQLYRVMVSPARFERATYALGGRRAIQLCHGVTFIGLRL